MRRLILILYQLGQNNIGLMIVECDDGAVGETQQICLDQSPANQLTTSQLRLIIIFGNTWRAHKLPKYIQIETRDILDQPVAMYGARGSIYIPRNKHSAFSNPSDKNTAIN